MSAKFHIFRACYFIADFKLDLLYTVIYFLQQSEPLFYYLFTGNWRILLRTTGIVIALEVASYFLRLNRRLV
jgi:hypothetical protein